MSTTTKLVVSPQTPTTPLVPGKPLPFEWLKWFQNTSQAINTALTILGVFNGELGTAATVQGRTGTLAAAIQHLTPIGQLAAAQLTGVVAAAQLPAALPAAQGAVQLPAGAVTNVLGSAAFDNSTAFDPAGAAATAQTNAETFATGAANTAQANAEAYANSLVTGATGTIHLAKLTVGGTNGSISVANGLIASFVDPT